jgi:hypothetical protein
MPKTDPKTLEPQKTPAGQISFASLTAYSSDFPPPEMLEGYKRVDPAYPERILSLVEETVRASIQISVAESNAAIESNKRIIETNAGYRTKGQWLIVLLFVLVLALAALGFWLGKDLATVAVVVTAFGAITIAAIKGVSGKDT